MSVCGFIYSIYVGDLRFIMSALTICLNEMKFDMHNTLMISRKEKREVKLSS